MKYTKEQDKKIIKLYNEGKNYTKIASQIGVSIPSLNARITILRKNGEIGYRYNKQKIKFTLPQNEIPKFLSADTGQIVYFEPPKKEFGLPEATLVVVVLILVATSALVFWG